MMVTTPFRSPSNDPNRHTVATVELSLAYGSGLSFWAVGSSWLALITDSSTLSRE